jgi:hypothetical protein
MCLAAQYPPELKKPACPVGQTGFYFHEHS